MKSDRVKSDSSCILTNKMTHSGFQPRPFDLEISHLQVGVNNDWYQTTKHTSKPKNKKKITKKWTEHDPRKH